MSARPSIEIFPRGLSICLQEGDILGRLLLLSRFPFLLTRDLPPQNFAAPRSRDTQGRNFLPSPWFVALLGPVVLTLLHAAGFDTLSPPSEEAVSQRPRVPPPMATPSRASMRPLARRTPPFVLSRLPRAFKQHRSSCPRNFDGSSFIRPLHDCVRASASCHPCLRLTCESLFLPLPNLSYPPIASPWFGPHGVTF